MEYFVIPSSPSYEINELYDIRNIKTKRTVKQREGKVTLYIKDRLGNTTRAPRTLWKEARTYHEKLMMEPAKAELPAKNPPPTLEIIEDSRPPNGLTSGLLNSILLRYANTPAEELSHKECIDLLKVLLPKSPVAVEAGQQDCYVTSAMRNAIIAKTRNRDYSGNNLDDVEKIHQEYSPEKSHEKPRNSLGRVKRQGAGKSA